MRKMAVIFCVTSLSMIFLVGAFCADENRDTADPQQPEKQIRPPQRTIPMNKNIAFISGSISSIDATTPGNTKLEVFNDADGKSHIVEVGADANILKVIEIGELKAGDKARIVARKMGDKEVSLSVVTGILKKTRELKNSARPVPEPMVKKDQIKK